MPIEHARHRRVVNKTKRRKGLLYLFLMLAFLSAISTVFYTSSIEKLDQAREQHHQEALSNIQHNIETEFRFVSADLAYLSRTSLANSVLLQHDDAAKQHLSSLMFQVGTSHKRYFQLRLLNKHGREVIRIDQLADGSLKPIEASLLQEKGNRYYFRQAVPLQTDAAYVSQFDLNIEHGVIERPFRPTIRFVAPIHDKQSRFIGATVINYNGQYIFDLIAAQTPAQNVASVVNQHGFYLKSHQAEKEWGFMWPNKPAARFSDEFPETWQAMSGHTQGKVVTADGEYYFRNLSLRLYAPFKAINSEEIFLVLFAPMAVIENTQTTLVNGLIALWAFLGPLLTFLAFAIAHYQVERTFLFQELDYEASHDHLTGLYNRRAIMALLQTRIEHSLKIDTPLAVSFIDVNDLKHTNDWYGHDMGDEMIKNVANVIEQTIKSSDASARIGGDEFLIVFNQCTSEQAKAIMQRIQSRFAVCGLKRIGTDWTISYGCSELRPDDNAETLMERADEAMYEHKKVTKARSATNTQR
ncbi:sensor domain-containing diguanylate cyclase [Vibrio sp. CAU 1672]|uniref:sensor domain-containing diguanylate cyclase n=1 Tax=Vibrio sp. CAU 1672 TaxID=3032594 RepID=UPI0023D99EC8|nr:sensor domain-containing diguanylate cyclase [Vibrio sp. CAU 1672]MDF2152274.1 sensor domain-containing diguanylate cyclase [Vibrio sp. CAU 1672]